jgi:hypothetical protein
MHRRATFVAAAVLLVAANGLAQTAPQLPNVTITLPPDVPSEKVWVQYVLYGPFGASGSDVARKVGSQLLQIRAAVGSRPAEQIKMFVWAPGCKIETFEMPIQKFSDIQESFSCSPLSTVALVGQISGTYLHGKKSAEVRVDYLAPWACNFFGLVDCMVPQLSLGTANPDDRGVFQIEIPDFSADPISSDSENGAELQVVLREVKTWNLIAFLEPELQTLRTPGGGLKVVPSFPQNLVFSARKSH